MAHLRTNKGSGFRVRRVGFTEQGSGLMKPKSSWVYDVC